MDLEDFKADILATATFLRALRRVAPKRVDDSLVEYLEHLPSDPCGLEVLYNSLQWEPQEAVIRSA